MSKDKQQVAKGKRTKSAISKVPTLAEMDEGLFEYILEGLVKEKEKAAREMEEKVAQKKKELVEKRALFEATYLPLVKAGRKSKTDLIEAQREGVKKLKAKAEQRHKDWKKIADDLLQNETTRKWSPDEMVDYIKKKLGGRDRDIKSIVRAAKKKE